MDVNNGQKNSESRPEDLTKIAGWTTVIRTPGLCIRQKIGDRSCGVEIERDVPGRNDSEVESEQKQCDESETELRVGDLEPEDKGKGKGDLSCKEIACCLDSGRCGKNGLQEARYETVEYEKDKRLVIMGGQTDTEDAAMMGHSREAATTLRAVMSSRRARKEAL